MAELITNIQIFLPMNNTEVSFSRRSLPVLAWCPHVVVLETIQSDKLLSITLIYANDKSGPWPHWIKLLCWLKTQKIKPRNSRGNVPYKFKASRVSMNLKQPSEGKNVLSLLIWPNWEPLLIITNFLSQRVPLMPVINRTDLQLHRIFVNQRKTLWDFKIIKDYPKTGDRKKKKRKKKKPKPNNPVKTVVSNGRILTSDVITR